MTVKQILDLISEYQHFELVGAMTGKRLCCSWNNKKDFIAKYHDCKVSDRPIHAGLFTSKRNDYTYPHIKIWVLGE